MTRSRRLLRRFCLLVAIPLVVTLNQPSAYGQLSSRNVPASVAGRNAMKQLSPGIGWVLLHQHLFWTQSNGADWADITPPGSPTQQIGDVFFLDNAHGWASLVDFGSPDAAASPTYSFACTGDGGKSWQMHALETSSDFRFRDGANTSSMFFLNPQRGWVMFRLHSSSNFSMGKLIATEDGGTTWSDLPSPPGAGSLHFVTRQDGWLAGGPGGFELWVTHDGGKTWSTRSVPPLSDCQKCAIRYDEPKFQNPRDGVLTVTIEGPDNQKTATYITHDGGESWQMKEINEGWGPSSVVDMHVIRVFSSPKRGLIVRASGHDKKSALTGALRPNVAKVDFAGDANGWLLHVTRRCAPEVPTPCRKVIEQTDEIELFSTTDGGSTLQVITPHPASPNPPTGSAQRAETLAPIIVHSSQYRPQFGWISQSAGERPDITLIPHGEGARSGRLWVRSVDNGLLIAGEVDGAQPDFPRSKAQILAKDHVEVWLSAAPTLDLPAIGWGDQFGDKTLAEGEDSCKDWAKELQDPIGLETKCRAWAAKQLRYRPYFKRLFMRQWLVSPEFVLESYATPAHEEILKRFAGKGDEALEILKPRGRIQMLLFPKQAGYSFEILIPFDAFPPLPALNVKELYLLVDVFNSAAPGKKEGAYSTSSAARSYGTPETFNFLSLDPPRTYHLSPCDLPLAGTDKRENFHPAWFLPDPDPADPAARFESDTFIILNDPAGYRYEPEGLSPTIRLTHYFWLNPGPGEWVCGPHLTYRKGVRTESYPYTVSEKGFQTKRLADGDLLIKTGPRVWYSEFGSGQCGACPRTHLLILDLTREMRVFGSLGLGEVIGNGDLIAQDYSVSPDWSEITEYNLRSDDKGEPRAWSSTTWCRKLNTRRYDARAYVYENCGEKENVQPPNPPVLKELREIPN